MWEFIFINPDWAPTNITARLPGLRKFQWLRLFVLAGNETCCPINQVLHWLSYVGWKLKESGENYILWTLITLRWWFQSGWCTADKRIDHKISARRTDDKVPLCRIGFRMENNIKTDDQEQTEKCALNLSVSYIVAGKIILLHVCVCLSFLLYVGLCFVLW